MTTTHELLHRRCGIAHDDVRNALRVDQFEATLLAGDRERLRTQIDEDEIPCFDALVALLDSEEMRTALGHASSSTRRDIDKYLAGRGRRYRYGARLQRSVLGYVTRAALKPTPFSHFAHLLYADPTGTDTEIAGVDEVRLVPTFDAVERLASLATDPPDSAQFVVNPTLRHVDGRLLGWRAMYCIDDGFAWRSDELVDATAWCAGPIGDSTQPTVADEPSDRRLQLLDGTLAVRRSVESSESSESSGGSDAPSTGRRTIDDADAVGLGTAGRADLTTGYHVVGRSTSVLDPMASTIADAVGRDLRERLGWSTRYDRLLAWATRRFGQGERVDLAEFLIRAVDALDGERGADTPRPTDGRRPVPSVLPPTGAVFWQLGDDDLAVVNNMNTPGFGTAFRYGGAMALATRDVAAMIVPDADPLLFSQGGEWNGIQDTHGLAAEWPSGREVSAADLDLSALEVEIATEGLVVLRAGRPVAPTYVGALPEHLLSGPVRIFNMLGNPWMFTRDFEQDDGSARPRSVMNDRLVTERARAVLSADEVARLKRIEIHHAVADLHRWCADHQLPTECFWKPAPVLDTLPVKHKPVFIDVRSPHLVAMLLGSAADGEAIMVEEAFPLPDGAVRERVTLVVLDEHPIDAIDAGRDDGHHESTPNDSSRRT